MANVTFNFADGATLTGTGNGDEITLANTNTDGNAETVTINGGAGDDTVVFSGLLDGSTNNFDASATGFTLIGTANDAVDVSDVETFVFDNGTVTSNASTADEYLLQSALAQTGSGTWALDDVLLYNGSSVVATNDPWLVTGVDGSPLAVGTSRDVVVDSVVVGSIEIDNTGKLDFTANTAYVASLALGEEAEISFDVDLTDGINVVSETLSVTVEGSESEGDDTFVASDTSAADIDLLGGDDRATGGALGDEIVGGSGNDTIFAGANDEGADTFIGNAGNDILSGGEGNDILVGNSIASASLNSGSANADAGRNEIFGGEGGDAIAVGGFEDASITFTAAALETEAQTMGGVADLQNAARGTAGGEAYGGAGNDVIIGTASGDNLIGMGDGNDRVVLNSGNDTVYAGADDEGEDTVDASGGDNVIFTGAGNDVVNTGAGNDEIGTGDGADIIDAGNGNNVIFAGAGNDNITTGNGDDVIYGGAGGDNVSAGAGNDTIYAGAGDASQMTSLTGGAGNDTFVFAADGGVSTISDFGGSNGDDVIDLTAFNTSFDNLVTSVSGGNLTILVDAENSITLTGVTTIEASDFIF